MYDVTNSNSFSNLKTWVKEAKDQCPENTCYLLLGNKTDLRSRSSISLEQAESFAKSIDEKTLCYQISCKANSDLESVYHSFVEMVEKKQ